MRLLRTMWWLLNISKCGDSITFLGNLCQCSVTPTGKSASWCSGGTSCVSLFALCLWSCYRAPLRAVRCCLPHSPSLAVCAGFSHPLCPEFHHQLMVAAAMATFDLHIPSKPLIVSMKSSTAPLLIDSSISQKRDLSAVHSRNHLNCLNSSVLCLQKISGCLRPQKPGLINVRLFLSACRGSDKGKLTETSELSRDQFSTPH